MSNAPDLLGSFVGWKGLLADDAGNLYSPAVPTPWPPGKRLVATCAVRESHKPPVKSCGCGIYAVKTFEELKENGYNMWDEGAWRSRPENPKVWVVTRVNLWGDVADASIGYRAQFAYPKKIYVPFNQLKLGARICDRYSGEGFRVSLGLIDRYTGRRS